MKLVDALPGTLVTINTGGDHWCDCEARPYMSYPARSGGYDSALHVFELVKVTRGGSIEVQVTPKERMVFAPRNVDVWDSSLPENKKLVLNVFYDRMIEFLGGE